MGTLARNGLTLSVSIDHYHSAYFTKENSMAVELRLFTFKLFTSHTWLVG